LFVGCSTESLPAARVIQDGLAYDPVTVRLWTDAVFGASSYTMDDLEKQLDDSDFAVLVLGPDDRVFSRGEEALAPRDNVILELGLFMGKLGRRRTYIVQPRGLDLKLPSNLLGLKLMTYSPGSTADLPTHLGPVCNE